MRELIDRAILALANAVLYLFAHRPVRQYRAHHGRWPNVADPQRYSERMLWRKIVDHNPQFVVFSDKLATKAYHRRVCPDLAVPETLWVGRDPREISDALLTEDVYVKANHGFDFHVRTTDPRFDRAFLEAESVRWLDSVHGAGDYQWAYGQVEPRLFVEEAIGDAREDLLEFCIFASDGRIIHGSVLGHNKTPDQWQVRLDREGNAWTPYGAEESILPELPEGIDVARPYREALAHTRKLSVAVDYARYDFMWNGRGLYGGEITVYPAGGLGEIQNPRSHAAVVRGWDLNASHVLRTRQRGARRIYAAALRRRLATRDRATTPRRRTRSEAV